MWSGKPSKKETLPWRGRLINETDLKELLKSLSAPPPQLLSLLLHSVSMGGHELFRGLASLSEA